ncbi:alpha/beta fold hydrolase [Streptomyces alkaliterrae]|uniref:Alpha/beta fold hydrolase n=1 Tax=Streptomyces alkaliterrae TaxID=2213162 RepID=A0A5P0YJC6_9ACTN|nr:alpha/beta hydrolase [Streptomyces alkaliterrae]MBB1252753.1 alpha/beta hydrolase [Streptomyces alkaliterrae]MBB1258518.1 alpha/beta hydrolase [Streptomyces alkaliterrae]MQS00484.1 alpha/beta fold hydrolase [Streptomyces alkaliterrae]
MSAPESTISLRRAAAPGAPRMMLLHGLAENESVWDACLASLPASHEIWSASLPWSAEGVTDWGVDVDLTERLREALEAVPGAVDVVVAHSMSANVLLDLLDRDGRADGDLLTRLGLRALVLVSPFYRRSAEEFDWQTISYYLNDFHLIMEEGLRVHSGGRLPADLQAAMAERVRDRVGPHGWLRFFELYLRTPLLRTSAITTRALVLGGEHDFAAPPGEARTLAAALPDADVHVLADSGHFPMIEAADRFAARVTAFVGSLGSPDPTGPADQPRAHRPAGTTGSTEPSGTGTAHRAPVPVTALEHRR